MKKNSKNTRLISCLCTFSLLATLLMPPLGLAKDDSMIAEKIDSNNLLYKDVQRGDYFTEALNFFTLTNFLPQTGDDLFHPRQPITRGEFFLWLHSFLYASEAHAEWNQEKASQVLNDLEIITGYEDGSLRLDSTISRAEAAVILQRVLQLESSTVVLNKFTDVEQGLWYSEAIGALANYQFIQGKGDDLFAPHDLITKAEAITILYRTLYQSKRIEDIQDGQLIINGQGFAYHPVLAGLFAESNRSALLNANIEYTMKDGAIETITSLYLNNKAENNLNLDGNGATIHGDLFVSGPTVSISNLRIMGELFVTSEVTDSFTSDAVDVEGFTFIMPTANNNENSTKASLPVYAHNTSFGGLILSRNIQLQSFQKDIDLVDSKHLVQKKLSTMKIASTQANETSPDIEKLLKDLDGRQDLLSEDVLEALLRQKEEIDQDFEEILRDLGKEESQDELRQNIMDLLRDLTRIESGKITQEQIEEIINSVNNTIGSPGNQYELDRNLPDINNRNNPDQDLREELRQKAKSEIEQRQRERELKQREIEEKQRETEERMRKELEERQRENKEKQSEELHETNREGEKRENKEIEEQEYSEAEQQDKPNKDIDFEFIIIGTPEDDGQDPSQLEIELEESEEPIIVISDTQLSTTDDGELSSVYLVDVAHFTVESDIEHLVIEQQDEAETTIEGRGQIGQLELRSGGQVSIAVQGEIERLVISNPEASIHVDENTIIENIELGEGLEVADVIQNLEDIGNNIRNINGQPYSPPATKAPSSGGGSGGGSKPPSYSGEPQTVTATFTVTDSVYKAIASGTIDGVHYKLEILPNIDEDVGDTVTFTIKRILLEQAGTVAAVEITGLGDRVITPTLSIPANLNADQVTFYERVEKRWRDRYTYVNHAQKTVNTNPTIYDSTFAIAVAIKVPTPTNIQAFQITADSVTLTWDEVVGATGYRIYKYHDSMGLVDIIDVETISFTDTGLTSAIKYGYDIHALSNNFESHTSDRIYVTIK